MKKSQTLTQNTSEQVGENQQALNISPINKKTINKAISLTDLSSLTYGHTVIHREKLVSYILSKHLLNRVELVMKGMEKNKKRTVQYFMHLWSNQFQSGVLDLSSTPSYLTKSIQGSFSQDKSPQSKCYLDSGILPIVREEKCRKIQKKTSSKNRKTYCRNTYSNKSMRNKQKSYKILVNDQFHNSKPSLMQDKSSKDCLRKISKFGRSTSTQTINGKNEGTNVNKNRLTLKPLDCMKDRVKEVNTDLGDRGQEMGQQRKISISTRTFDKIGRSYSTDNAGNKSVSNPSISNIINKNSDKRKTRLYGAKMEKDQHLIPLNTHQIQQGGTGGTKKYLDILRAFKSGKMVGLIKQQFNSTPENVPNQNNLNIKSQTNDHPNTPLSINSKYLKQEVKDTLKKGKKKPSAIMSFQNCITIKDYPPVNGNQENISKAQKYRTEYNQQTEEKRKKILNKSIHQKATQEKKAKIYNQINFKCTNQLKNDRRSTQISKQIFHKVLMPLLHYTNGYNNNTNPIFKNKNTKETNKQVKLQQLMNKYHYSKGNGVSKVAIICKQCHQSYQQKNNTIADKKSTFVVQKQIISQSLGDLDQEHFEQIISEMETQNDENSYIKSNDESSKFQNEANKNLGSNVLHFPPIMTKNREVLKNQKSKSFMLNPQMARFSHKRAKSIRLN